MANIELGVFAGVGVCLTILAWIASYNRYAWGFRVIYPTSLGLITVMLFLVSIFEAYYGRRVDCLIGVILGLAAAALFGLSIKEFGRAKRRMWMTPEEWEDLTLRVGATLNVIRAESEGLAALRRSEGAEKVTDDKPVVS